MKSILLFFAIFLAAGRAEEFRTKKGPVNIRADKMTIYKKERKIIFEGNVSLKQEDLSLSGDYAEVFMDEKFERIERVTGRGNIKAVKGDKNATCGKVEFNMEKGMLIMMLNPVMWTKNGMIKGEIIRVYTEKDIVEVEKAITTVQPSK